MSLRGNPPWKPLCDNIRRRRGMRKFVLTLIALSLGFAGSGATAQGPAANANNKTGLYLQTRSKLDQLVQSVLPSPGEQLWMQVRWRKDINQACAEAKAQSKPILVWLS